MSLILAAVSLRIVFNEQEVIAAANVANLLIISASAIEMDNQYGAGALRDCLFDF